MNEKPYTIELYTGCRVVGDDSGKIHGDWVVVQRFATLEEARAVLPTYYPAEGTRRVRISYPN